MDAPPPYAPTDPVVRRARTPLMVVAALAAADVGVRATRDTWERHSPDDYAERLAGCAARRRDFVAVGGSPVSEGIDPAVLTGAPWDGVPLGPGYALGLPGATTSEVFHAVRHGCPEPPRVLIYGITASDLNGSRNEPHGPYSLMTAGDLAEWWRVRPDAAEWATRHYAQSRLSRCWALFRFRHGIRMAAALAADGYFPGCCPEAVREARDLRGYADALRAGDGYAPNPGYARRRWDEAKRAGAREAPFNFLDKYHVGSHRRYLDMLLDRADAAGTAVVLVDMPVTADLEARFPGAFAEYRRALAEVEAARRLTVLRARRDAVGLTDADFADIIHLNPAGARKLSAWVRGKFVERQASKSRTPQAR